ncbi:MAG: hypothetical protein IJT00_09455 [Lachnospiraceae bacterium]|nr:hypothetical protein [Lachnospiraceae bacterium]
MKLVGEREAYENLANAIIKLAADDYKSALIRLKRHPDSESAKRDVERQEKFFYSEWFEVLTDLDPSYLIRRMKEMVNEG